MLVAKSGPPSAKEGSSRMDTFIQWATVILPTLLGAIAMWYQPPRKKHPLRWRFGIFCSFLLCSVLTLWQQRHEKQESRNAISHIDDMFRSAQQERRALQLQLDDSLRKAQRLNDQNNDLLTDLKAQSELLEIVRNSLPANARKRASNIRKRYVRELSEGVATEDNISVKRPD